MSFFEKFNDWASKSIGLKLVMVGIIVLLLMIPSSMLDSLVYERQNLRDGAISEVSQKWGSQQLITGPILTIPFKKFVLNENKRKVETIEHAHFFPDSLSFSGIVKPDKRYRGIYVIVLYNTQLQIKASFSQLNLKSLGILPENLLLDQAFISLGISDLKGIKSAVVLKQNGNKSNVFGPGIPVKDLLESGISTQIPVNLNEKMTVSCVMDLNGSKRLSFTPIGKETIVDLQSSWDSPSFEGAFLPEKRDVSEKGFTAHWKVLELNRNFSQQGIGKFVDFGEINDDFGNSYSEVVVSPEGNSNAAFGVKLLLPIDEYKKTLRSSKYSTMFILLTFLVVFFAEIFQKKKVHPIQYLLTGSAICLFYVLLLSLSEHFSFNTAYLISCISILIMIGIYAKGMFKSIKIASLIVIILGLLYGFFYSLLQLQDYALLMGSIGLLIVLAIIMYTTRNIDWYNTSENKQE